MPCYEVRTISVEFKIQNINLLKKALEKLNLKIHREYDGIIKLFDKNQKYITIDVKDSIISSSYLDEKTLTSISNQIKRTYAEQVIEEISQKQKWIKKNMGNNKYQLQRF